jgi:hypothetical protein
LEGFMEKRNSNFEDHLSIVENGHQKVASKMLGKTEKENTSLLAKLAAELGLPEKESESAAVEKTEAGAPVAEGDRAEAGQDISSTSPEVAAQMAGVEDPQVAVAGGDPAMAAAGMAPHVVAPFGVSPMIATGEATMTMAQQLNKTPEAVAAGSRGAGGAQTGSLDTAAVAAPEKAEAEKIGQLIAESFQKTLEKAAADQEYTEALNYLSANGLFEGFEIKDAGMSKTASYEPGALEKIANKQALTREDVINAAYEYSDLEKQAAEAEQQGREDAHALVDFMSSMEKTGSENGEDSDQEKIAELMKDPGVVSAIKVLKAKNLL